MAKKTIVGCLHAHYTNIEYIEQARIEGAEWIHFVDPGLMMRISGDAGLDSELARRKAAEQIDWIAHAGVDAILVTCTNYIALLEEERLRTSVPIIKLDEAWFESVCGIAGPQLLLFSNPATVEGTMRRLSQYAASRGVFSGHWEALLAENSFPLIMQGRKQQYEEEIAGYIRGLIASRPGVPVTVAQLSLAGAAGAVERETGTAIGNPLKSLTELLSDIVRKQAPLAPE